MTIAKGRPPADDPSPTTKPKSEYRRAKLTQTYIDKLIVPPEVRRKIIDTRSTGLILEASGENRRHRGTTRKVFKWTTRIDGQQITITLGVASPVLTLADAERQVTELKFARVRGLDPRGLREPKSAASAASSRKIYTLGATLDRFVDEYLAERTTDGNLKRSLRYRIDTERYLRAFADGLGAARDIATIERPEIRKHLAGLTKRPVAANRALIAIQLLFKWAASADVEILEASPAVGLKKPGGDEIPRKRCLSDAEIAIFWRAALAMPQPFSQLFRTLLASGQRLDEISSLRWSYIIEGADGSILVIPDTKNGKSQSLPLSSLMAEIIGELPKTGPFIFTGRKGGHVSSFGFAKEKLDELVAEICKKEGFAAVPPFRSHDLRRTASTVMARLQVTEFDIARVLNHSDRVGQTPKYNLHSYDREKLVALEKLAVRLRQLTGTTPPTDNVEHIADHRAA